MKDIRTFAQEGFFVLTMDNASRILNSYMVSLGTCTATLVHPREVFRPAVYDGAAAVAFVHNHPSGNPTPSGHDRELTNRLQDAATILGIKVTDHIVIGYERYGRGTRVRWHSFRESGYMD
jgi:DNA repair protein RadC